MIRADLLIVSSHGWLGGYLTGNNISEWPEAEPEEAATTAEHASYRGFLRSTSAAGEPILNYLTIESRWPGVRCRVRRTEVGWRTLTGGRVIFDAVRSLVARACGAESCPLGTERRP